MITKDLGNKQIMADNLRHYIDSRGMNIKEFAVALDFKYTTVLDWVNAKTYPRIDKIEMMANYFNIEKSDLVERKSDQMTIEPFDLATLVDDSKVDWDKWVSYDGKPLSDEVKSVMKLILGKRLEK